jgi:hypothetical protein
MWVSRRTAQSRLFTGIQSTSDASALELRTMPTPAWPEAADMSSPDDRRKYLVEMEGALSSITVEASYIRVSEMQQTSTVSECKVRARAAC